MAPMKETGLLTKDQRKSSIEAIITFFSNERGEEIGVIAAEEVLDFFLHDLAGKFYNKGVADAKDTVKKRFDDLEADLDMLVRL